MENIKIMQDLQNRPSLFQSMVLIIAACIKLDDFNI